MPFCPKCGEEVPPDAVHCPHCGVDLATGLPHPPRMERPPRSAVEFSWGKSFRYAVRYILYAILWIIIGGIIMGVGMGIIAASMELRAGVMPTFGAGAAVGIITTIIGLIIMYLGTMASYFKIMSRLIYEATYEHLQ
ncbi:MAG: zinc ribbon domain-containing protein [Candidatus Bathyarchaeia archaeon]